MTEITQHCKTCNKNERQACPYIKRLFDTEYSKGIQRRHIQVMKKVTAEVGCMSYLNNEQEHENPEMRCYAFHRLWVTQPENCYNCVHRHGYPVYLFGDDGCENFIKKEQE